MSPRSPQLKRGSFSPLSVLVLVLSVVLLARLTEAQLTQAQINQFVSEHNTYRAGVSPTAANMQQIVRSTPLLPPFPCP